MAPVSEKLLTLDSLAEMVDRAKGEGNRVAMCHGCFDILHLGHLRHFEAARALGDLLVVTVTPDRFVSKGPNRPLFPEQQRASLIAGLQVVDWVAVNRWSSAVEAIRLVKPDLFIKGSEYESRAAQVNPNFFAEAEAVQSIGGTVAFTTGFTSSSTAAFKRLMDDGETSDRVK